MSHINPPPIDENTGWELSNWFDLIYRELVVKKRFTQFTDQDTTPSVDSGFCFKTNNTAATTISNFDDGHDGQTIIVVFGDGNTTIDFTGTNLKGNNSADWTPAANDHMTCVFDGVNWYCDVSNN